MLLTQRVQANPTICGIQLDFSATGLAAGNFDVQPFYNSNITDGDFKEIYYSIGSVSFSESSSVSRSGFMYVQKLRLKFPSMDKYRSQRLEELRKTKFISLKLSTDQKILLGRNDFFQNAVPKIAFSSNEKATRVEITTESLFPIGFFENTAPYGFVYQIPISFLEPI